MKRTELEHVIRAAAAIAADDELIVIGSQSVLGGFPDAPPELCVSNEVDVYPKNYPERSDLIDGAIGELSMFHDTFGYYAQGVGPETAVVPTGWENRWVAVRNENTKGATGWCLEIHDLLISKYVAGREKDYEFIAGAIRHRLVDRGTIESRLSATPISAEHQARIAGRVARDFVSLA